MADMSDVRVVLMTAPERDAAERIVRLLVEERLIACGNIVPGLSSIYRWKETLEQDAEVLVIMKTVAGTVPTLLRRAAELHPYDVPELLSLSVEAGHPPYLAWVRENTESNFIEG